MEAVKNLIKSCLQHNIPYLSIFAFSSENWNRPSGEVNALMELLSSALVHQSKKLNENGVKLTIIGDISRLDPSIQQLAADAIELTAQNSTLHFNVAINYGGRWDIVNAARKLAQHVVDGTLRVDQINEESFADHLATAGIPDPDLYIRTSGEYRISNFMLWQAAYSEFYFVDTLWPDFDEDAFTQALYRYTHRDRRFGGAVEKIE